MYRNKKSGALGIIITIIILILVVIFSNNDNNTSFVENFASKLVMPIQNGLTYLKNKISGNDTFFTDINDLKSENEKLKSKLANDSLGDVMSQVKEVNGVKVLASRVADVDMNGLRNLGDQLKEKLGEGVILLASVNDGKVSLMATATDGAMKQGAHAGNLIKAVAKLVGGGGGGRPNMAQAGGKNPAGVEDALKAAKEALEGQLA